MITIRDVAKLAGVSPSTVSRVINGTVNVNEEKKKLVLKAIEETGFKPNLVARSLYKKSSKIIGALIPITNNPFFTEMIRYIEDEAFSLGYKIIICYSDDDLEKEKDYLNMLIGMNADGLILLINDENIREQLESISIPTVVIDRNIEVHNSLTQIVSNNYKGGRLATEYLIKCGCKNIVNLIGPLKFANSRYKYEGYMDVCKENDLDIKTIDCDYTYEAGLKGTVELLEKYPNVDGIIAANDIVAISAYKILTKNNFKIPNDIMIIGYDNIQLSSIFTPEITTINQPIEEMGRKAVNCIVGYNEGINIEKNYIFDVELVERQTTFLKEVI